MSLRGLRIDAISGKWIARDSGEPSLCGFQYFKENAASSWIIEHGRDINFLICAVFVSQGNVFVHITPEKVEILDSDTISIEFFEPVSGFVNILYYTEDHLA